MIPAAIAEKRIKKYLQKMIFEYMLIHKFLNGGAGDEAHIDSEWLDCYHGC